MFRNDYILRMIEMMGDLLRRLTELADKAQRLKLLDNASRKQCGLSLQALEALDTETMVSLLPDTPRLYAEEFLYLRGITEENNDLLLKSLRVLLSLTDDGPLCEVRAERVAELENRLMELLTCEDFLLCAEFFEKGLFFAECEDAVFRAAEVALPEERQDCRARGYEILKHAASANERDLAFCNTSREEMQDAANDFNNLFS